MCAGCLKGTLIQPHDMIVPDIRSRIFYCDIVGQLQCGLNRVDKLNLNRYIYSTYRGVSNKLAVGHLSHKDLCQLCTQLRQAFASDLLSSCYWFCFR